MMSPKKNLFLVVASFFTVKISATRVAPTLRGDGLWKQAEHACAPVQGSNHYRCVQDILDMRDLGMASFWVQQNQREHEVPVTDDLLVQARQACAKIQSGAADYHLCIRDVLETRNLGLAELWLTVNSSSSSSSSSFSSRPQTPRQNHLLIQARKACAAVSDFEACLQDVMATQDLRWADSWTKAEARQRQLRGDARNDRLGWATNLW